MSVQYVEIGAPLWFRGRRRGAASGVVLGRECSNSAVVSRGEFVVSIVVVVGEKIFSIVSFWAVGAVGV